MSLFKRKKKDNNESASSEKDLKKLIKNIIAKEWEQRRGVTLTAAKEGYAVSKFDYETDRTALLQLFPREMLESMEKDLENDPSIMRRRKIYSFYDTDPEQYEQLRAELPEFSPEREAQTEAILKTELEWAQYTEIHAADSMRRELPVDREEAIKFREVSFITDRRAELDTYGTETFNMFAQLIREYQESGRNLVYQMYDNKAKLQGFVSLASKEEHIRRALATPC